MASWGVAGRGMPPIVLRQPHAADSPRAAAPGRRARTDLVNRSRVDSSSGKSGEFRPTPADIRVRLSVDVGSATRSSVLKSP